jgi:hypothetical protein
VVPGLKEPAAGQRCGPHVQQGERVQIRSGEVAWVIGLEVEERGARVAVGRVVVPAQQFRRVCVAYRRSSRFCRPAQLVRLRLAHQRAAVQIVGLVLPAGTRPRSDNAFRMREVFESAIPVDFATAWEVTPASLVSQTAANTRSCDGPGLSSVSSPVSRSADAGGSGLASAVRTLFRWSPGSSADGRRAGWPGRSTGKAGTGLRKTSSRLAGTGLRCRANACGLVEGPASGGCATSLRQDALLGLGL